MPESGPGPAAAETASRRRLRLLLADDHVIFREGLRSLIAQSPDMEVVAEVGDGREAVERAAELRPDVAVVDISLPRLNGIDATRQLKAQDDGIKVVVLSMHVEKPYVAAALNAGADGYVPKSNSAAQLQSAVRAVVAGQTYLSPEISGTVIEGFVLGRSEAQPEAMRLLTERERSVLQLLAEGRSPKGIATRLHISAKTVGTHRTHIMDKLGIHSVAGLTRYAIREGLSSLDDSDPGGCD